MNTTSTFQNVYLPCFSCCCVSYDGFFLILFLLPAAIVSYDGLPVLGDGPAGTEAYKSDLQASFSRDILWWIASFLHPLGIVHAFFPLVELWYLPVCMTYTLLLL